MKCKGKRIYINGLRQKGGRVDTPRLECIVTHDEHGKTLTINDGVIGFTIPFEPLEKYLK